MDTHDIEFSIVLIKSTSITQMEGVINTVEDHNVISEAVDNFWDDRNTIGITFIVRMKVIC